MNEIIYKSKRGKIIIFDDYCNETDDDELGGYWVYMCPKCHNKYKNIIKGKCSSTASGEAVCSVKGCENNNSIYYVDFNKNEITERKE